MVLPDMFEATILIIAVIVFLLVKLLLHKSRNNLPPGPRPWPFLGNVKYLWRRTGFEESRELVAEYGPLYTIYFGRTPIVALASIDVIQEAFGRNESKFTDDLYTNDLFPMRPSREDEDDYGVAFANGELWNAERKRFIHSVKDMRGERQLLEIIHEELKYLIDEIDSQKQTPFDPEYILQIAASNKISKVIFGSRFDHGDATLHKLLKILQFPSKSELRIDALTPFVHVRILFVLFKIGKEFSTTGKIFAECMKDFEDDVTDSINYHIRTYDPRHLRDCLDDFIKLTNDRGDNNKLSEMVMARIFEFYFGGSETAHTLRWILLYMINYPDVQKKCGQEIAEVVGDRPITAEDQDTLPYVGATIYEVIRMSSVVRACQHRTTCDGKISGYGIPKGTIIAAHLEHCNRDPKYWAEPEIFSPEHFLDSDGNYKANRSFLPFPVGINQDLGVSLAKTELFLFFATLVQTFEFKKESPDVHLSFDPVKVITFQPKKYKLVCLPRKE